MSALGDSSLRLADDLLDAFQDFNGSVSAAAVAYNNAKAEGSENDKIEAAGDFLRTIGEAEQQFHGRYVSAALNSQARDQEHIG